MLGKLFKHEFKDTGKVLLPLNLALIGVTILGAIMLGLKAFNGDGIVTGLVVSGLVMFYILAIIALFIVTYIYLMMRFYRSMYSDEGYLTHTLPVSTFSVLNTKIIVSVFWTFLTMVLTVLSVFALTFTAMDAAGALETTQTLSEVYAEFESDMGMSFGGFIGWFLLFMLLSSFSGILMIYCSISIGQLFNKHKVLASIVTYVIIYIVLQVANTLISLFQSMNSYMNETAMLYMEEDVTFMDLMGNTFGVTMIESVVLILIYYITCAYISNKHLNLD